MPEVRVGVAIIIKKGPYTLYQRRQGSHGAGTWALPGGHLEFKEGIEECGAREVLEETGLAVRITKRLGYVETVSEEENRHYITLYLEGEQEDPDTEPRIMEPDKCDSMGWYLEPPHPRFEPLKNWLDRQSGFALKRVLGQDFWGRQDS